MTALHRLAAPAAATLLPLALLAGCGDDAGDTAATDSGNPWNDADVAFATGMIPHHAQALVMVDMTMGRDLDPELAALTEQIRAAQAPEIETMADWLDEWDEPVPETMRDHANAHGDGSHLEDSDMPGMMSGDELDDLDSMSGEGFEEMWLEMMIEHHEGAIEMAETEMDEGKYPDVIDLAEQIRDSQQAEIEQMEQMLAS